MGGPARHAPVYGRRWGSRTRADRIVDLFAIAPALCAIAWIAAAQERPAQPPVPADLQAALSQADAGKPGDLTKLADSGRSDAQAYAAVLYIFGRGGTAKDPVRGCAYAEKASQVRADAAGITAECYRRGLTGKPDLAKAEAAYTRATAMGDPKAKGALCDMLLGDPTQAARGLTVCKASADAGDVATQMTLADAYYFGRGAPRDRAEARKWYQKAADQKNPQAARKLGEMYAAGDGGKRDPKKAVELWRQAEKAGDPLAPILVADQLFADITGGKKPGPGTYAFKGGVPVADIEVVEQWYREALERDPRPDVKQRAQYALQVLGSFKTAGQTAVTSTKKK
jgi:TPR repeat protein